MEIDIQKAADLEKETSRKRHRQEDHSPRRRAAMVEGQRRLSTRCASPRRRAHSPGRWHSPPRRVYTPPPPRHRSPDRHPSPLLRLRSRHHSRSILNPCSIFIPSRLRGIHDSVLGTQCKLAKDLLAQGSNLPAQSRPSLNNVQQKKRLLAKTDPLSQRLTDPLVSLL